MTDFSVTSFGSVWSIVAVSEAAREFAIENFPVEGWQGSPTNFSTDHRAARDLCERLADEGWSINGDSK